MPSKQRSPRPTGKPGPKVELVAPPRIHVLGGPDDRAEAQRLCGEFAAAFPGAELVVLPGAGHMLMFERRAELEELLVRFATRTAGAEMTRR